ncbi:MAG: universal stress protein [Desulfotignum sp.]|nr:universal stress protein [Desulfotignum sp.]
MSENKNRLLVALDGSQKAFRTITYLCTFKPFLKKELVLHNIITRIPQCYYDLRKDPSSYIAVSRMMVWESGYRSQMEAFMEKAKTRLIDAGYRPEAIHTMIAQRKKGIAQDILDEARKGYDALVIRRRGGAQQFLPLVLGSVSTRLVEKTDCLPIFLAGNQVVNHRLCIAIDGSEGSKRAAEFTADFVRDSDCRIFLCSVIREVPEFDTINVELEKGIIDMVGEITDIFKRANIPEKNISFKSIKGEQSRADAIVKTADKENCDTVVFGRRGISDYSGFEIGRVPWKVIHGAQHLTVWMVP